MENYKELGPSLFKMSVTFSPAKRLGVPEEVCSDTHDTLRKGTRETQSNLVVFKKSFNHAVQRS